MRLSAVFQMLTRLMGYLMLQSGYTTADLSELDKQLKGELFIDHRNYPNF